MSCDQRGSASGWQVYQSSWEPFGWRWSAYGPNGGTMGTAKTKEEAEERAQRAMRDLQGFDARAAGRRAIERHGEALRRLADD